MKWKKLYNKSVSFMCPYCLKLIPLAEATIDHRIPKGRGGTNDIENLVLCCEKDNNRKGMLNVEEYELYLLLDRIRKGQKNERDLETLERYKRELLCIVNGAHQNDR